MPTAFLPVFLASTLFSALLISWIGGWAMRAAAPRVGLIDTPDREHKTHREATPLGGGLAVWLGVIVPLGIGSLMLLYARPESWLPSGELGDAIRAHLPGLQARLPLLWSVLSLGTVVLLLGLWDDLYGLPWKSRLGVEILVAAVVVWELDIRLTAFIPLPILTDLLSIAWIVLLINSFNMLDNMDGLSGGVGAICAAMLAAVVLIHPLEPTGSQWFVGGLLLLLAGSLIGLLWHNSQPARLFMGDAGSYFLGYLLAVSTLLATFAGYGAARRAMLFAPLCVFAVPLYDTVSVILIRLLSGKSPFVGDRNHLSHRLVRLGFSRRRAVLTVYLITATCGLGALLLPQSNVLGIVVVLLITVCMLAVVAVLETNVEKQV